jgi:hypothetical protein
MWKGSELKLVAYTLEICSEWVRRGYEDTIRLKVIDLVQDAMYQKVWGPGHMKDPYWLGIEGFHLSHRSNLISKNPEYYQKYWPEVPPGLPYIWPPYRGE